ncbi:hypothetical protein PPROV_000249800 [Pycnococcus provasolii]|uniref:Sugar phosphate transporter domain-containing protein n=1 Tax=Pycnococcus provasolii TaxID=41880 RepID=A0A830HB89_9CHLO|nr:hypothetical protein PPROV_000249800 [Pycnococcus provasolii]
MSARTMSLAHPRHRCARVVPLGCAVTYVGNGRRVGVLSQFPGHGRGRGTFPPSSCQSPIVRSSLGGQLQRPAAEHRLDSQKDAWKLHAAAANAEPAPDNNSDSSSAAGAKSALATMALFVIGWYAANCAFNIVNKQALNLLGLPYFISLLELGIGCLWMLGAWATGAIKPPPKKAFSKEFLIALLPVSLFHCVGHVAACLSFSKMAVSFGHVIKSTEPVFSVLLSVVFLGKAFPLAVWLSLIPIVAGASVSAMKELSFSLAGTNLALLSNVAMAMRSVASKKALEDFQMVKGVNLYAFMSFVSLAYLIPVAIVVEGHLWQETFDRVIAASATKSFDILGLAQLSGPIGLAILLTVTGIFYHLYNQLSYDTMDTMNAVSFSVANTMKRVAVIVSSVLFFQNPVSPMNWLGIAVAVAGTYAYSVAARKK